MNDRLPMQRIVIPRRETPSAMNADDELRRLGVDLSKFRRNAMGDSLIRERANGLLSDAEFRRSVRNMVFLNPNLKVGVS